MIRIIVVASLLVAFASPVSAAASLPPGLALGLAPPPAKQRIEIEPPTAAKLTELADRPTSKGLALQYGVVIPRPFTVQEAGHSDAGTWQVLPDGRWLWRLELRSPGAVSLELAFDRFFLPQGAELWFASADGGTVRGPWTDADNPANGQFHTPVVWGDSALLELVVPAALRGQVSLHNRAVGWAYRDVMRGTSPYQSKSGSCNVDTRCVEGDNHREQIESVAAYTFFDDADAATLTCTGQLLNNTAQDRRRLFSTANHCVSSAAEANSAVFYWKYESPDCRVVGSQANGTAIPRSGNSIAQTGGAQLLATYEPSDFTLMEVRSAFPAGVVPYWSGWDRSGAVPPSGFTLHHAAGDEKRISFENEPVSITTSDVQMPRGRVLPAGNGLRVLDWDLGTTEVGSSGGGLFNPQERVVGFYSGGNAQCGNDLEDYFGRLSVGWTGGGGDGSRLSNWLDPDATGAETIDGRGSCTPSAVNLTVPSSIQAGDDAVFTAGAIGDGPFTYAWDVDGDGVIDRTQPGAGDTHSVTLRYPSARSAVNVGVTVTDSIGCVITTQRAMAVTGPRIEASSAQEPIQVCGDGDAEFDPGELWRLPVGLVNNGSATLNAGYAAFAPAQAGPSKLIMAPAAVPTTLAPGAIQVSNVQFQVERGAACGSRVAVEFLGAVDAQAFSRVPRVLYEGSVAATCQVQSQCLDVAFSPPLTLPAQDGLYANSARFGNGIGSFIIPNGTDATYFGAWFTGEADRDPTWLIMQGRYVSSPFGEQGVATLYRFRMTGSAPFAVTSEIVGSAMVAPVNRQRILVSWTLDGVAGAELMSKLYAQSAGAPNRTGVWFSAGESGWGEVIDDHVVNGANESVVINYLYGTDNVARWTLGASSELDQGPMSLNAYRVHCPTCPSFPDFGSFPLPAGTMQRSFSSQTRGTYSTNSVIANPPLNWVRSNLPVEMISRPQ